MLGMHVLVVVVLGWVVGVFLIQSKIDALHIVQHIQQHSAI